MFGRFKERFSMGRKLAKKQPKIIRFEALEERVLFSADFMAGLDNFAVDEQVLIEDVSRTDQFAREAAPAMVEQMAAETRCELIVINPNIADYEQLTADLQGSDNSQAIEVVVLEADRDGIEQVSEILADRSDLAAVHFITHGADGQINLGNSWLNRSSLQQNSEAIAGWGRALTETGDFLFYGCNIAADSPGRKLLSDIARLTAADVAASDDLTGHAQYGGDWVLEYDHGNIETAAAINSATQQNWNGVLLTTFTVNTTADTVDVIPGDGSAADALGKTSLRAAIMEANALGGVNEIILNAGTYTLSLGPAGDDLALNGDLDVTGELTITGAGADVTIIDGNSLDSVFNLKGPAANLTLTDLTIQGGNSHGHGGGIHVGHNLGRLTATRVIVTGNTADKGAGIYNHGSMTLTDVVISNNGDAGTREGGGIYNEKEAILNGVTISGNQADDGGGIYHDNIAGSLSLTNVTVSGNSAANQGGGLHAQKPVTIVNSTFTLNSAATGGGISKIDGTIDIKNTIVARNLATLNPDVNGLFNSQGNNLIGNQGTAGGFTHGVNGDQAGTAGSPIDPLLGSLQDNGGFTQTHALLAGSPAIDAGTSAGAPAADQCGSVRPADGDGDATATVDIGAFEYTPVFVSYYLDGVGDGTDIPTAVLKTSAPTDPSLDNFDPGRDTFAGLALAGSDLGLNEADTTKYQQWITSPGASWLNGPASLTLWSAMKDFNMTKAGSITAYLVDSDAAGNDLTQIASAAVTRADWDVANTGTWIEETFDFGVVDYALKAGRYLGVKIVVNNGLAADAMWLAYDVTGNPSSLTVVCEPNSGPTGSVDIDNPNPVQGDVLTASNSLADADGLSGPISYQWQRDGVNIGGANGNSYTTVEADVDAVITVVASYTDDLGFDESVCSAGTTAVTNVNDAPVLGNNRLSISEGDTVIIDSSMLSAGDVDNTDSELTFNISAVTAGRFERVSTGSVITTFTQADIAAAEVRFVHDGSETAPGYSVSVTDGSASAGPTAAAINFTNVNDAPVLGNNNLSISEGATVIIDSSMLSAGDLDNSDSGLTFNISAITAGRFERVSTGSVITTFTQTDIAAGEVRFVHDGSETAPGYSVSVTDGSASAGPTAAVINFTNVNDAPVLGNNRLTISEGATVIIDSSMLSAGDVDNADAGLTFNISVLTAGQFERVSTGSVITAFTQADIAAGEVRFVHDGSETAPGYSVSVTDGSASAGPAAAAINFTRVNDPGTVTIDNTEPTQGDTLTAGVADPDGAAGTISYQWYRNGAAIGGATGAAYTTTQADVGKVMTVTANYTDDLLSVESITSAPTLAVANINDPGTLTIDNTTPSQGDTLTAGVADPDGAAGTISYQWYRDGAAIGGATAAAYTTTQADVGKVMTVTADYTDDLSTVENLTSAGTAAVINVNDAPVLGNNNLSIHEGATVIFDSSMLSATDVDNPDPGLTFNISAVTAGQFERVSTGSVITAFTQADIAAGEVQFVHDGSQTSPSYYVSVSDGSAGAGPTPAIIDLINVNDAPVPGNNELTISEGATVIFDSSMLSAADVDNLDSGLTFNITAVNGGQFERVSSGLAITTFTQADIAAGEIRFVHDGSQTTPSYNVSVSDGSATTSPTAAAINFTNVNDPGTVTIDNTAPTQGDTLTAGVADPDGAAGTIAYQWYRDGAAIGGATAAGYTTTQADVGKVMTVTANYTDDLLTVESITSAPTLAVANINDPGTLTIDNTTPSQGDTLTAGVADPDGAAGTISYQWYRDGAAIGGATAAGYTTTQADVGKVMTVTAKYIDDLSGVENLTSAGTAAVTNVNDAPVLGNNSLAIAEGDTVTLDSSMLSATDVDHSDSSLIFNVSGVTAGYFAFAPDPGTPITSFDQSDITSGNLVFVHDGSEVQPGYSISVTDGADSTAASPADIAFSYQNETAPPSIEFLTLQENAADVPDSGVPSATDEVKPGPSEAADKSEADAGQSGVSSDTVITITSLHQGDRTDGTVVFVQDSHNAPAVDRTDFRQAEFGSNDAKANSSKTYFSYQRLKLLLDAQNVGELKTALGNLNIKTLSSADYDLVRNSLDAIKEEIGKEIQLGRTVVGSAIAASIGLSVGYVVWLLKGGSLLASVLSSLPAWQLADPLAILAGHKGDDDDDDGDDDDDETLETIIDDGSTRDENKKSSTSELNSGKKESV